MSFLTMMCSAPGFYFDGRILAYIEGFPHRLKPAGR